MPPMPLDSAKARTRYAATFTPMLLASSSFRRSERNTQPMRQFMIRHRSSSVPASRSAER